MSRPLRIEYPDAWYHVMNRGRRTENIFTGRKDYQNFIELLQESSELFGVRIAAYCLMPNHYHLLLQTPNANLSRVMRHINGVYTQRFNRQRQIDGQLFRGRYKCILVEADNHLLELVRYIHRNPVRAGLSESVNGYEWSSHKGYVSNTGQWDWLYRQFPLEMFSDKPAAAKKAYRKFVQDEESSDVMNFFSKKNLASVFGSQNFVQWIKDTFHELKSHGEVPQSRQLAPTIPEIKEAVVKCYGIDQSSLKNTKRGWTNAPKNLAILLCRELSGAQLDEICTEFGLGSYSSVSSTVIRTKKLLSNNNKLQKQLEKIKKSLQKGQANT